jgi:hypothetical protein
MSYDIHLAYPDERECLVGNHADGGTFVIGGTDEAWLNVTYNYSRYFYRNIDDALGIRWLYGKTGQEAVPQLRVAIERLEGEISAWSKPFTVLEEDIPRDRVKIADPAGGPDDQGIWLDHEEIVDPDRSYWAPTPHNAVQPLHTLLSWAEQHPEATFGGD